MRASSLARYNPALRAPPRLGRGRSEPDGRSARVERSRSMSDVKGILEGWRKQDIGFVRFELPDMHGISRSKTIPIAHAFDYAERGLNMYGGTSVLDYTLGCRRRDAVSRGARLRRPAAVPRSGVGPGAPVGRPDGAVHLRRPVVRRVAARGHAPARLPAGPREGPIDGVRAACWDPSSSSTS